MGANFSEQVQEARDENVFTIEGVKLKKKELPGHVRRLQGEIPQLQQLEVKSCRVNLIPPTLIVFTNLQVLKITDNKINSVPPEMTVMKLTSVDFTKNSFSKFPVELSKISTLKSIVLARNDISSIPGVLSDFANSISTLNFEENSFSTFPTSICLLESLTSLNFNNNKINSIPREIVNLTNLRELFLKGNQLSELNSHICELRKLEHLDISENNIKILPREFQNLTSLINLELQHNQLTIFPTEICCLTNINILKLHGNNIQEVPDQIANLQNLCEFYLQENKISFLSPEIGRLSNLRKLYLEYNNLSSLPEEITYLKKIVVLILHHNNLSRLPLSFSDMTSLLRLSLNDNPLGDDILRVIHQQGALALISRPEPDEISISPETKEPSDSSLSIKKKALTRRLTMRRDGEIAKHLQSAPNKNNNNNNNGPNESVSSISKSKSGSNIKTSPGGQRSKDAETGVPNFDEFKEAFNSTLEEQDFSQKKKEMLKKLPDAEKWMLLTQYKGSTLQLLRNQSRPNKKEEKKILGVAGYLQMLREGRLTKNNLNKLKLALSDSRSPFLSKFIDSGGIPALSRVLQSTCNRRSTAIRETTIIKDVLEVFSLLLASSMKSVLTSSGAVYAITMGLSSCDDNKFHVISLLELICQEAPNIGPEIIAEALTQYSKVFEEVFRYFPLVSILENINAPQTIKVQSLSIINNTLNATPDLDTRYSLRMELQQMGFNELILLLKNEMRDPNFEAECLIYDEDSQQDFQDMRYTLSQSRNLTPRDGSGKEIITVLTDTIHTNIHEDIQPTTTFQELFDRIVAKCKVSKPEQYGISLANFEEEFWPGGDEVIQDVLLPEYMLSFKFLPWELTVRLPDNSSVSFTCNPSSSCGDIVMQIAEAFNLDPEIEYHIFLDPNQPFDDVRHLVDIPAMHDPFNRKILVMKEKPVQCKVYIGQNAWQVMSLAPGQSVEELKQKILRDSNLSNPTDYDLILESDVTHTVLDMSQSIQPIDIRDSSNLRLILSSRIPIAEEEEEDSEGCNIWDEPPEGLENITFFKDREKIVTNMETATLNVIIQRLTSPDEYSIEFANFFVMMYESFTSDLKVIEKLEERFNVPDSFDEITKSKVQARVLIFLKFWIERKSHGCSPESKLQISQFVKNKLHGIPNFELTAKVILDRLENPKLIVEVPILGAPPQPRISKNLSITSYFDIDDLELARQLTIRSFQIYSKIKPQEFFKLAWSKPKLNHLAPNILAMIDNYNEISSWISTAILTTPKIRERCKLMQKFINVTEHLRDLNNYHLVSALVSALNHCSIQRLKFTKARLSRRHQTSLSELESLVDMKSSFSNYRAALEASKPPCIPFLGVYLTDLVFVTDGNPDFILKRVNLFKFKLFYKTISLIQNYQATPYSFETVELIQQFLSSQKVLSDKELHNLSLEIEPRGADRSKIQ